MDDAAAVGVAQGVGNLADEVDSQVQRQGGALLLEVVIETDLAGLAAKQDGGAEFMLGVSLCFEDAGVAEALEDVVFAFRHLVHDAGIDRRLAGNEVNADSADIVLEGYVFRVPILESAVRAFGGAVDELDILFLAQRGAGLEGADDTRRFVAVALADADTVGFGELVAEFGV